MLRWSKSKVVFNLCSSGQSIITHQFLCSRVNSNHFPYFLLWFIGSSPWIGGPTNSRCGLVRCWLAEPPLCDALHWTINMSKTWFSKCFAWRAETSLGQSIHWRSRLWGKGQSLITGQPHRRTNIPASLCGGTSYPDHQAVWREGAKKMPQDHLCRAPTT